MNLGDLKVRFYDITGDSSVTPRFFDATQVVALMNEGTLVFRTEAEDKWSRTTVDLAAGTAVYPVPSDAIRVLRIAYDDMTLEPKTIQSLSALDPDWNTRTGAEPIYWTSDGVGHDEFRLYPIPDEDSALSLVMSSDYGVLVDVTDTSTYTFVADGLISYPAVVAPGSFPAGNIDRGPMLTGSDGSVTSDWGILAAVSSSGAGSLTIWYVLQPETMVADGDLVPLHEPWQIAPLWYALWKSYEQERERHNAILAAYYRDMFFAILQRAKMRTMNPLPRIVHTREGKFRGANVLAAHPTLGDTVTLVDANGVPTGQTVSVQFPRRVRFR